MDAALQALTSRLQQAGIDPTTPLEYGATPLAEHAQRLQQPVAPWLAPLADYVEALHSRGLELWSPLYFSVPALTTVAGERPEHLASLLRALSELLLTQEERGVDRMRTEQYAVPALAQALGTQVKAFHEALAFGQRMTRAGQDPGWMLQGLLPAAWGVAEGDAAVFREVLGMVEHAALRLSELGVSAGYPFSVGVAALCAHGPAARAHLPAWLERVVRMARSVRGTEHSPYPLLEYGLAGLGRPDALTPEQVTAALDVGVALCDRGLDATATLQAGITAFGVPTALTLEVAAELARSGIQPLFVLTTGLPAVLGAERGGAPEARVPRLVELAKALHAAGHGLRLTFEDGLPMAGKLEVLWPGLMERALSLTEALVARGLNPGLFLARGLPRALGRAEGLGWAGEECLELARELVELGVDPEPALSYAVPSLLRLCGSDSGRFRTLRAALHGLVATLHAQGLDWAKVLFYDVQSLAEAGGQPHAFADLLERLQALLARMEARGVDPRPFLLEGLPAAAREAAGKPWVLVATFEAAARRVEEGRGAEVAALLSQGTAPLVEVAGEDAGAFERLLLSLERRYPHLPTELVAPAVSAACLLAGTRPELLEQALGVINRRLGRPVLEAAETLVAQSLPGLAALADSPEALAALLDAAIPAVARLPEEDFVRELFLRHGLGAIAEVTGRATPRAVALLSELAARVGEWPKLAPALLRHGAYPLAKRAQQSPEALLRGLDALAHWARGLDAEDAEHAQALERAVALCGAAAREDLHGFLEALSALREALPEPGPSRRLFFQELVTAQGLVRRWPESWSRLVLPLLRTHRQHAGRVLSSLSWLGEGLIHAPSDFDVLRDIVTQAGVRAGDLLYNLVGHAMYLRVLENLTADRDLLQRYLREVGLPDARLYARYRDIHLDVHATEAEKRARGTALREEIASLQHALREGALSPEQESSALLGVALSHLFPPALSASRDDYVDLYQRMPDRPHDVDGWNVPPELRRHRHTLARGSWQLRDGAALDRAPWELVLGILRELPEPEAEEPAALLGWELLRAWTEGRVGREATQRELLARLFTRMKRGGLLLPTEARTAEQLRAVQSLLSDPLRDAVEAVLLAARAEDVERFSRLVQDKLAPPARVGPGLLKAVQQTVDAVRAGTLAGDEATARLAKQLHAFEVEPSSLLTNLLRAGSPTELKDALSTLTPVRVELEPGKEVHRLHADLVGQCVQAMQRELHGSPERPGALEYRASSDSLTLEFELTKRQAHAAVGYSEGVCVASDVTLWNRPEFLQCVFWDEEGTARGGMHLFLVEEEGQRYLTLPGINPSVRLLSRVEAGVLLDAVVDYAWRLARHLGLRGVWVPASPAIHSNRGAIQDELASRRWRVRECRQPHAFSKEPYAYSFDAVLEVPER